jgi:hypothetical protein
MMKGFLSFIVAGVLVIGGAILWTGAVTAIAKGRGFASEGTTIFAWLSYLFFIGPGVVVPLFVYVFD